MLTQEAKIKEDLLNLEVTTISSEIKATKMDILYFSESMDKFIYKYKIGDLTFKIEISCEGIFGSEALEVTRTTEEYGFALIKAEKSSSGKEANHSATRLKKVISAAHCFLAKRSGGEGIKKVFFQRHDACFTRQDVDKLKVFLKKLNIDIAEGFETHYQTLVNLFFQHVKSELLSEFELKEYYDLLERIKLTANEYIVKEFLEKESKLRIQRVEEREKAIRIRRIATTQSLRNVYKNEIKSGKVIFKNIENDLMLEFNWK